MMRLSGCILRVLFTIMTYNDLGASIFKDPFASLELCCTIKAHGDHAEHEYEHGEHEDHGEHEVRWGFGNAFLRH